MKILERYILRRTFVVALAALFWTLAVVWTVQALSRINLVTDSGQSALAFFHLATLVLPSIIPVVLPFAVAIGISQTLTMMNSDSELAVISAAGSSRMTTIRPALVLALGACLTSFFVQNVIDPGARLGVRTLLAQASADLLSTVITEGTFRKVSDGLYVQVGERLPDGRLGGIFVADSRQKDVDLAYYAKEGALTNRNGRAMLVMNDGVVHRKTPAGEVSVIRFTSYVFDLSVFTSASQHLVIYAKDRSLAYLADPDPNDPFFKANPQEFNSIFHQRLTEWLYPLVFALIALAVAGDARSHREARVHPMITALTIALIVRWISFFAAGKAETDANYVPLLYVIPLVAAGLSVWCLATNRPMELPVNWTDRAATLLRQVGERLTVLRLRLFGASSPGGGSA
ncbi:LPS export ABC transporter permease LptF [Mesorhizobium sp. L-8-3]|uniref:LPS export ABC transporter permease LptF n=1 Tax=Mesorhizobium sp. L-8-3 TaxID=2744522 RepID=UPI001928782B|nr:LPS export ABC transporter permease LptF [Mesorhizobium sp. L-8-3]BCH25818.1 LPS export ABC transporter permease LptF [Mesorhizobium sp. L-8-3]